MACVWVLLASRITDERLCGKPGDPQCLEHQRELDAMMQADRNWDEMQVPFEAVGNIPRKK
jgi:hypothetical protein